MSRRLERTNMRTRPTQIAGRSIPFEIWAPIEEFEHYFVSSRGRVCGVDRITSDDKLWRGRVLKPGTLPSGHKYVVFYGGHHRQVHRLMLTAFVGPCPEGHEGLHGDDCAAHNVLTNLRWGTRSQNIHDGIRNGKIAIGEAKPQAKLTEECVRWIRLNAQFSMNSLAMQLGVSCAAVKQVRDGVTWKHVV